MENVPRRKKGEHMDFGEKIDYKAKKFTYRSYQSNIGRLLARKTFVKKYSSCKCVTPVFVLKEFKNYSFNY